MEHSSPIEATKPPGGIVHEVGDFFRAAAYSAVQTPINGLEQIANAIPKVHLPALQLIDAPEHESLATNAGKLVGSVADFVLLQKGLAAVAPDFFGASATTSLWLKTGVTGAAFQTFMPVSDDGNYFLNKARDVGIGFGTFAAMGYATQLIAPKLGPSFVGRVEAGAGEGIAAGGADVALSDLAYMETPSVKNLRTIARYAAFGAMLGATDYMQDTVKSKIDAHVLQKSIESNQQIFQEANEVVPAQKQLYNVQLRKVTDAAGDRIVTLENPGGELVKQGDWVATRLDEAGKPVIERGQINQWPIVEKKILKTYNVDAAKLQSETDLVAPTRVDGPPVHVVQLKEPIKIHTPWGSMKGASGDWLANYDYNAATKTPGTDFAIISSTSFGQTYKK